MIQEVPKVLIEYSVYIDSLVSRDPRNKVNQARSAGGRHAVLIIQSYQQSLGGKYECRVVVLGNNLENLSVCVGEYRGVTVPT